jgi:hypothetical protein
VHSALEGWIIMLSVAKCLIHREFVVLRVK